MNYFHALSSLTLAIYNLLHVGPNSLITINYTNCSPDMGGVLCALQSAAITVRDWAWNCAKGLANFMSKVVDFIKDQFSKLHFHFCYSNQRASASTSSSEDGLTCRVEVTGAISLSHYGRSHHRWILYLETPFYL